MVRLVFTLLIILAFSSCTYFVPNPPCPPPPRVPKPRLGETFSVATPVCPPTLPDPFLPLNLAELVSLALENSPTTRKAWFHAKSAAADVGVARGAYLPPILFSTNWVKERFL